MKEKEFLPLISQKLNITQLNPMQIEMMATASQNNDIILLSPTGSGKTLAFILPMLKRLNPPTGRVQAVVIAPSRELVLQIYEIIRLIAASHKVTPLYGGHKVEDEVNSLATTPDIIISTPGRLLDHINRRNIDVLPTRILVLDEFDKSLELGFEEEMSKILRHMKNISRRIMTSATDIPSMPDFINLNEPKTISYLDDNSDLRSRIAVHKVESDTRDKLQSLLNLLLQLSDGEKIGRTIIFVNHRESAIRINDYLRSMQVFPALYHGALDQIDREKAIALFNNGTAPLLVATDLASRGLDIDNVKHIIHYHLPISEQTYTHRNGRTARISESGHVYIIVGPEENLPEFITIDDSLQIETTNHNPSNVLNSDTTTLYIAAGKKEKISKGDIVGFLIKQAGLISEEIGNISINDHYSLVAIPSKKAKTIHTIANTQKLKGARRKVHIVK